MTVEANAPGKARAAMAGKFEELWERMSPERRAAARARTVEMLAEMPLSVLRHARGLTQEEMAQILATAQARVSKQERRDVRADGLADA
jgi:DNA-binding transcriptional regulator YiaG